MVSVLWISSTTFFKMDLFTVALPSVTTIATFFLSAFDSFLKLFCISMSPRSVRVPPIFTGRVTILALAKADCDVILLRSNSVDENLWYLMMPARDLSSPISTCCRMYRTALDSCFSSSSLILFEMSTTT